MSKRDNDSLEEFFRKATRQHDVEYNEADWKKLERMLDEQQPLRRAGWFATHGRKVMASLAFLIGVIAVLVLLSDRQATDSVPKGSADDTNSGIAVTPDVQDEDASAVLKDEDSSIALQDEDPSSVPGADREPVVRDDVRHEAAAPREEGTSTPATRPTRPVPSTELAFAEDTDSNRAPAVDRSIDNEPQRDITDEKELSEVSGFNHTQIEPPATVVPTAKLPGVEEQVRQVQDQPDDSASVATAADALEDPAPRRRAFDNTRGRFGITVVAAPDFSMTPRGGSMGAGDAVGVYLHYQVLPRWSVTTGVLIDNKKYWGKGNEYRPPRGYWKALTNGVVPDRIDGTCFMYEVPVGVTFDIVNTRRTRLFASAGLSSYFVRNEEYYYHFDTPNPGAVNGWTGQRPSTLWFGIGTLSAGFDFKATRTLSLGIEPYFKVPLEGMGWADIDLYSAGVMFAARYHFVKKANKHPPTIQGP
jgi:hypothetical protein